MFPDETLTDTSTALVLMGLFIASIFVFVIALAVSVANNADGHLSKRGARGIIGIFAFLMGAGFVGFIVTQPAFDIANEERARVAQAREKFFEERGVNIPESNYPNLEFPRLEPAKDQKFGIAQANKDGEIITVQLAYEGGEVVLYGTDGQAFEPLEKAE